MRGVRAQRCVVIARLSPVGTSRNGGLLIHMSLVRVQPGEPITTPFLLTVLNPSLA
jgi:hypothetical protein